MPSRSNQHKLILKRHFPTHQFVHLNVLSQSQHYQITQLVIEFITILVVQLKTRQYHSMLLFVFISVKSRLTVTVVSVFVPEKCMPAILNFGLYQESSPVL